MNQIHGEHYNCKGNFIMITNENFSKACTEVLEILKNIEEEDYKKISKDFLENLNYNSDKNYNCNIDFNKSFQEQNLLPETIDLLACIYRQFWCNEEDKREFDKVIQENEIKYQNELREKYKVENIFNSDNLNNFDTKSEKNNSLVVIYKQKNIIRKILDFIKSRLIKKNK